MKTTFKKFPEVILLDATHKTNDLRMPLYLMLTVDSNGESEVVAAFIVTNEEEQMIRSMIQTFKEHNPAWEQVKVAQTDKDMVERKTLTSEMPVISLLICLFHVLRTFKREITTEKMDITAAEKTEVLEILQELAYSSSEDTYEVNQRQHLDLHIEKVTTYYNKNWHPIRHEWVEGLKQQNFSLDERTTNRVESTFQKISYPGQTNKNHGRRLDKSRLAARETLPHRANLTAGRTHST